MFQINNVYNFATLAPTILGAQYNNLTVKGVLTIDDAMKYSDVLTTHESVKAVIPGLPATPSGMVFIRFVDTLGNSVVMSQDYIDPATVTLVTAVTINIQINNATTAMEPMLRMRLKELGINNFTLTAV